MRETLGYGPEALTHAEIDNLIRRKSLTLDRLRNRTTAGGAAGRHGGGVGGETGGEIAADILDRIRQQARLDLELALRRYFTDEVSFGHIEADGSLAALDAARHAAGHRRRQRRAADPTAMSLREPGGVGADQGPEPARSPPGGRHHENIRHRRRPRRAMRF